MKPPKALLVAWCPVCGSLTGVAKTSQATKLITTCGECPSVNWPSEDHPPRVQRLRYYSLAFVEEVAASAERGR